MRPIVPAIALLLSFALAACTGPQQRDEEEYEEADFHYQLAQGYFQNGEVPFAIRELQLTLEVIPDHVGALYLLGFIYQGRMDYPMAESYYEAALDVFPGRFDIRNNLGSVYLAQSRWADAEDTFRALTREPTYSTPGHAHNNLGWALYEQGRTREAIDQFEMALMFQPDLCLAWNNAGLAWAEMGNAIEARHYLQNAVDRCNDYAEPRYRLAQLLIATGGDPADAVELFEECVELGSEWARRCAEYLP